MNEYRYWIEKHEQAEFGGYVAVTQYNRHPPTRWNLYGSKRQAWAQAKWLASVSEPAATGGQVIRGRRY